jgi:uncharacterized phage-like protein YoqJ
VSDYTIAVTGHRPEKLGGYQPYNPLRTQLTTKLEQRLMLILCDHPNLVVITGMALGFDQWVAGSCRRLSIPYIAAVPFDGQERRWPETSQRIYIDLLKSASRVHVVCPGPYLSWKMQRRNVWMIDNCVYLIAAWDGSPGGTANCVEYAKKVGRSMENLLPLENS